MFHYRCYCRVLCSYPVWNTFSLFINCCHPFLFLYNPQTFQILNGSKTWLSQLIFFCRLFSSSFHGLFFIIFNLKKHKILLFLLSVSFFSIFVIFSDLSWFWKRGVSSVLTQKSKLWLLVKIKIPKKYLQTQTVNMTKSSRALTLMLMMMKIWKLLKIGMTFFTMKSGLRVEETPWLNMFNLLKCWHRIVIDSSHLTLHISISHWMKAWASVFPCL